MNTNKINFNNIKSVHIIGIGGCASSAIAEFLNNKGLIVTGSEQKKNNSLSYLENKGIKIFYCHDKNNLHINNNTPDIVLYSPAVYALNPNNPELLEAKSLNIPLESWQNFIGDYLNEQGKLGITVSGSEGKGTTAGVLTAILKDTNWDPLAILGAKMKKINAGLDSNIYLGRGNSYILEGDEYNRNFLNYHPSINIMINLQYDHPETYKSFDEYKEAFYNFFCGMQNDKTLILRATNTIIDFVNKYNIYNSHNIIWFGDNTNKSVLTGELYSISNKQVTSKGISFELTNKKSKMDFNLPILPGYMVYNAVGAIIAALKIGISFNEIQNNIKRFNGMVRRFDLFQSKNNGIIITDYGHSPEAIGNIIKEIRNIFPTQRIHLIFQPHLFSRTYNFFEDFITELKKSDKVTLIDIYPARENPKDWENKVSSIMLYDRLKKESKDVYYAGKSSSIVNNVSGRINKDEITCFIGAGDMDLYYHPILESYE